jgi:hypothetical protein
MNEVFSGDSFIAKKVLELKNQFNINVAIETGSHIGRTTSWLVENFEKVFGIEPDKSFYDQALINVPKATFILGNSQDELGKLLDTINERCFFYIDSHWGSETPTPKELKLIAEHCKVPPVILIHDFHNPNIPSLRWDSYKDFTYKWENIEHLVKNIYNEQFDYFYNEEYEGSNVGVIYIIPKE